VTLESTMMQVPGPAEVLENAARTEAIGQRLLRHLDRIGEEQRAAMVQLQALADENAALLRAEERLRQKAEHMVELQRLLSHSAVHDLRGALTVAMGSLELVMNGRTGSLNERQRALIAAAQQSGQQTIDLAQTVLDLARLEAGAFPLTVAPLSGHHLRDVVERVVEPRRSLGWTIAVRIEAEVPVIHTDHRILSRVLANLLDNAAKYAPGSPVAVGASATADGLEIEVRDHGPGVPVRARETIFAAFQQAETNQAVLGSGLGLAFCRLAASALGGHIRLETPSDGGARFVVHLPIEG